MEELTSMTANANLHDQNDKNDNWPNLFGVIFIFAKIIFLLMTNIKS